MYVYFFIPYKMTGRVSWSKKKFDEKVRSFVETFENVQIEDYMHNGCNWWSYGILIEVSDRVQALETRKQVEKLCRSVNTKCSPTHFSFLDTNEKIDIGQLYAFGEKR